MIKGLFMFNFNKTHAEFLSPIKILNYSERLLEWKETGETLPITTGLDLTLKCSHKCPNCPFKNKRKVQYEPFSKWDNIKIAIDNLNKCGVRGILFTGGGEPLENPYTTESIKLAKNYGISIALITNGEKISIKNYHDLLACCDWIRISIDACTQETYKKMHGVGENQFDKLIKNVSLLVKKRNEMKAKTTIGISMLTSDVTINEMPGFAKLASKLDVDYCQFRPLQNPSREDIYEHKISFQKNIEKCLNHKSSKLRIIAAENKYKIILNGQHNSILPCNAVNFVMSVGADANVYLCAHHRYNNRFIVSNILDEKFFELRKRYLRSYDSKYTKNVCPIICKYDGLNSFLYQINKSKEHINFL